MTYTDGVHLVADSLEELHRFARSLGLKACWFQAKGRARRHPHYDLTTARMRSKAIANGARVVTCRKELEIAERLATEARERGRR